MPDTNNQDIDHESMVRLHWLLNRRNYYHTRSGLFVHRVKARVLRKLDEALRMKMKEAGK